MEYFYLNTNNDEFMSCSSLRADSPEPVLLAKQLNIPIGAELVIKGKLYCYIYLIPYGIALFRKSSLLLFCTNVLYLILVLRGALQKKHCLCYDFCLFNLL